MQSKQMTFTRIFGLTKTNLISVIMMKSEFYDATNKKVIGKLKDKTEGIPITEFVELKSKMYSYILTMIREEKK